MAEFSRLIITADGQALLAKIMTGSGNVAFTKISSSSHGYTLEELQSLHELADVEQTSAVSKIERTNAVAVRIETAFSNKELTGGYYMRALGLYALDPDAGEILYAVTAETSGNCYMPAYNGVTVSGAYVQLVTTVGNAENVSLEVNEAGVATVRDIKKLQERMEDLQEMLETGSASVCFDDFPQRENIRPQDTLRVILGKIRKWFADLGAAAFASIANNCATTEEGHVLDARQGTALQEQVDEINGNLGAKVGGVIVPVNTANTYASRNFTYPDGMDGNNSVVIPVLNGGEISFGSNATVQLHGSEVTVFGTAAQNYHITLLFIRKNI